MKEIVYFSSAILTGICLIIGMSWYVRSVKNPSNKPNLTVIILWALLSIIIGATYKIMVNDWLKSLLVGIGILGNIYIMIVVIIRKNYIFLKKDILIIVSSMVGILALVLLTKIENLYIIMQIINTIAYVPLALRILDGKGKEPLGPWIVISLATVFNLITVVSQYSDYWSLIHPVRSLLCQAIIIIFIKMKEIRTVSIGELSFFYTG